MPFTDEAVEVTDVCLVLLVLVLRLVGQDLCCLFLCFWVSRRRDSGIVGSELHRSNLTSTSFSLVADRDRDRVRECLLRLDIGFSGCAEGDADLGLVPVRLRVSLRMLQGDVSGQ